MSFSIIFQRKLIMGHRLYSGLSLKCKVPHGHNEIIKVEIKSLEKKALNHSDNMLIPFEKIKKSWHNFIDNHLDHAFQLSHYDPLVSYFQQNEKDILPHLVIVPGDPTTEMLCACLMSKLDQFLKKELHHLYAYKIKIHETNTNTVSLKGKEAYLKHLPPPNFPKKLNWWNRADFSINDF